jgi:hypothetical protein
VQLPTAAHAASPQEIFLKGRTSFLTESSEAQRLVGVSLGGFLFYNIVSPHPEERMFLESHTFCKLYWMNSVLYGIHWNMETWLWKAEVNKKIR